MPLCSHVDVMVDCRRGSQRRTSPLQHHHNINVRAERHKGRGVAYIPGSSSSSHQPPPTPNFLRGCFCAKAEASSFFLFFIVFSSSNFRKMHNFVCTLAKL